MLIALDSRKRVSLTKLLGKSQAEFFDASVNKDGDIILKPMAAIPEREKWVYETPGLAGQILQGLADVKAGSVKPYSEIR